MDDFGNRSVRRTARRGAFGVLAFWLLLMGVLYLGFDLVEQWRGSRYEPYSLASGELMIPRGRDGHFRVPGTVNGEPVLFLVDTGASLVTVSEAFARRAGLHGGRAVTFRTANGEMPGRLLNGIPVEAGGMSPGGVRVAIGLVDLDDDMALLGQSFLSRFDIEIGSKGMVLRAAAR
ncbi:MAG: clan AA aspartic protease [Limnobacter sp.]|nr:clan AA aspartic protease [Limnobacter sp.]